jgi:hypothetical protein
MEDIYTVLIIKMENFAGIVNLDWLIQFGVKRLTVAFLSDLNIPSSFLTGVSRVVCS